jgi:UDP-2,3-diacylglucosamine pyrophosphatase LpxH
VTDRILVAGDVHLGSDRANADAFTAFLEAAHEDHADITEVVLLGDIWDLIRRDPFGAAWETNATIARLQRLGEHLPVRIVLGNHDTYLHNLDGDRYSVEFTEQHVVEQQGTTIRFCHGNSFDRLQWNSLSARLSGPGDRGDIDPTRGRKDPFVAAARSSLVRGTEWVRSTLGTDSVSGRTYPRRERRAHAFLDTIPEDKLVYGHTHAPYVHHENLAANPGSWTATPPVQNTYLTIQDGRFELYQYRPDAPDTVLER